MNLMKLAALKGLVLGAVFAAAGLVSQPATADDDGWRGQGGGYYVDRDDRGWRDDHRGGHRDWRDWRDDDHRGWRRDHRDRRGHDWRRDRHDRRYDGRVWCPTHRVYAFAWELGDSRRHRHGGGHRDSGYWDREYSGYRDRDRHYRGW